MADTEEQQEFLEDFVKWQSEKKISGLDVSPQAFLIDRAKNQALSTLIEIAAVLQEFVEGRISRDECIESIERAMEGTG